VTRSLYALVPASYLLLQRGSEVLLQRRAGTGYMDGHWVAGAAGHVEPGETAAEAAVREAQEELGIGIREDNLRLLTVMQRTDGTDNPREQRVDWFFTTQRWTGVPQVMEAHKCAELAWHAFNRLPNPIPAYERIVIEGLATGDLPLNTAVGFAH
jgi:8-oxo-dGTP diphosphatase